MKLPVKMASIVTGISENAIRVLVKAGLLMRYGSKKRVLIDLDELLSVASDSAVMKTAIELGTAWTNSRKVVAKKFLYRLMINRGLIPVSEIRKLFGVSKQNAVNLAKRHCTVRKVLSRNFIVPDERWQQFVERMTERIRKQAEQNSQGRESKGRR